MISDYTYQRVKDKVIARELDLIFIKGEEKPIRIYELIDLVE
jgi:adenylate cyclase